MFNVEKPIPCPCYLCKERNVTCHAACGKYKDYREKLPKPKANYYSDLPKSKSNILRRKGRVIRRGN